MTGALYLVYFLTAILAQFLVGRGLAVSGNFTNVIATVCYLVVTLLFFWPVQAGEQQPLLAGGAL